MASEASKTFEADVDIEKMFDVITDFEKYPEFLQSLGLVEVKVDSRDGNTIVSTTRVKKMGTIVSYTLRYTLDRPRKVTWTLVKGQMMSLNEGSWVLEQDGTGRCRVTYTVEVKFGLLVPKTLIKLMINKELPTMMEAFKSRAESR